MAKSTEECSKCGATISSAGCENCQSISQTVSANPIIESVKKLLFFVDKKEELPPGRYQLVRKSTGEPTEINESPTKIGRDRNNDLVILDDTTVSRFHALVFSVHNRVMVEDLGSTNGTFINGRRIFKQRSLGIGDKLTIGKTDFSFMAKVDGDNDAQPHQFGKYKVQDEVARGAMGVIYKALDPTLNRIVAIKQLNLENLDPERREARKQRFEREALMLAKLHHPNITSVFEVKTEPDNFYYVMEFVAGLNLRQLLDSRRGPLTPQEYAPYLDQMADALIYAHKKRIVHRDIKPENIIIGTDNRVKLSDFGVAREEDSQQSSLTRSGALVGTLCYSSPEQLNDPRNVDYKADIYSLGVVSYEALSGKPPFVGLGLVDTMTSITQEEPVPLDEINPNISASTAAVIRKALRKNPKDRYPSAKHFAEDFRHSLVTTQS